MNKEMESWFLYIFKGCPFCVKVERYLRSRGLKLNLRDAMIKEHEEALLEGGGRRRVPCLFYKDDIGQGVFLYESDDIINFIEKKAEKILD